MKRISSFIALTIALVCYDVKPQEVIHHENPTQKTTESYFLKAKINGNWIYFNQVDQLNASFGPFIETIYDGVVNASLIDEDDYSVVKNITIIIRYKGKIGVGSYAGGKQFEYGFKGVTLGYMDAATLAMYVTDVTNPASFLKINELNDIFIKGSFAGELINTTNQQKISITDGEFYIKCTNY